jgi:hypothetical protein
MSPRRLFLGREAYRRRRLGDATRVVAAVFGAVGGKALSPFSFARGAVWLALSWGLTIAATALLHRALAQSPAPEDEDDA